MIYFIQLVRSSTYKLVKFQPIEFLQFLQKTIINLFHYLQEQVRTIRAFIIYGSESKRNHIMIIKLYEPLNFKNHEVMPACLSSSINWDPTNSVCFYTGWRLGIF